MVPGLPYDSEDARGVAAALTGILTGRSYHVSALMAQAAGPFAKFDLNREHMMRVIRNHARVAGFLTDDYEGLSYEPLRVDGARLIDLGFADLLTALRSDWQAALETGEQYGFRNAQVSVLAPTGTISFAMDAPPPALSRFSHISFIKSCPEAVR